MVRRNEYQKQGREMAACEKCGSRFSRKQRKNRTQYCSPSCRSASSPKMLDATCGRCGAAFVYRPGNSGRFCSRACLSERRAMRCLCVQCGRMYTPRQKNRVTFCSRKCSQQHGREQGRFLRGMRKYRRAVAPGPPPKSRACRLCGAEFTCRKGSSRGYCTTKCRRQAAWVHRRIKLLARARGCRRCGADLSGVFKRWTCDACRNTCRRQGKARENQRRRARKRGVAVEVFDRDEIFKRDGWRCQRCGVKVRPWRDVRHPRYPNLDHIVPLARGGEHTRKNVQCLCRGCNTKKGASVGGDQLLLVG